MKTYITMLLILFAGCVFMPKAVDHYRGWDDYTLEQKRGAWEEVHDVAQTDIGREYALDQIARIDKQIELRDNPPPEPPPPADPIPKPPSGCGVADAPPGNNGGSFVWKPVSESNHKLVVLVDRRFRKHHTHSEIIKDGQVLEKGNFVGDTHNGCRPHFRFSKPGSGYGNGLIFRLHLKNGSHRDWAISEGGRRVG